MARNTLPPGYLLHWYRIQEVLGQGGFGITYLALDTNLNQEVAIKEYLPATLAHREKDDSVVPVTSEEGEQYEWGLERFIAEAQLLAQFKHPNIVRALTVFSENNTAYMVMEFEHGRPLDQLLKERSTLKQHEIESIIFPLLNGLSDVHRAGFIHRDIKPANIYLRSTGSPVLLDFGSARQALGSQTQTLTTMVSPGFAPFEQYVSKSDKQGAWTDIYGLAATMYRAISGRSPSDAMDRSEALLNTQTDTLVPLTDFVLNDFTHDFIQAVDKGLEFSPEKRPQSIEEWKNQFDQSKFDPEKFDHTLIKVGSNRINNSESEADTLLLLDSKQNRESESETTVNHREVITQAGSEGRLIYLAKDLLKWLVVLFIGLFLLSLCERKISDTEMQPHNESTSDAGEIIQDVPKTLNVDSPKIRLISQEHREKIEELKIKLRQNSSDQQSKKQLKEITDYYSEQIKQAVENEDIGTAIGYLQQLEQLLPDQPRIKVLLNRLKNTKQ